MICPTCQLPLNDLKPEHKTTWDCTVALRTELSRVLAAVGEHRTTFYSQHDQISGHYYVLDEHLYRQVGILK
jgi:hypothetical protein